MTTTYYVVFSIGHEYGHLYRMDHLDDDTTDWHYFRLDTKCWDFSEIRDLVILERVHDSPPLKFESHSEALVAIIEACSERGWHSETQMWLRAL